MIINYTYDKEFEDLFDELKKHPKYAELADMDGIGKQTDIAAFSKKFFSKNNNPTADVSVDANANVEDGSIIAYEVESAKPVARLNAYYLMYKYGKQLFDKETAEEMVKSQFFKDIYVNDFHKFHGLPYSYHPHTSIVIRRDGDNSTIEYITLEQLFSELGNIDNVTVLPDREYFNTSNIEVLNDNNSFVKLKTVLRHKTNKKMIEIETKNGLCTIVTSDHPVIMSDNSEIIAKDLTIGKTLKQSNSTLPLAESVKPKFDPYVIGFWLGDGSAFKKTVTFYQNDIVKHKIYHLLSDKYNVQLMEGRKIMICSKELCDEFSSYGRLSHERHVPKTILRWTMNDIVSLLCGLIDAEGTIMPTGSINIRINSFALVQQVSELAKTIGLKNVSTRFIGKPCSNGSYVTNREMYKVSFRITEDLLPMFCESLKVLNNIEKVSKPIHRDGRFETAETYKLVEFPDGVEYVYDITTETGDFHCQGMIQHNCFNFSCFDVVTQGLPFVNKIQSKPPKHLSSFMGQMIQFVTYASNSIAGAVGLADLLICCSWYVDKLFNENSDVNRSYLMKQVKQELQSFLFSVNQPFRGGQQSAFTNVSLFDDVFLDKICGEYMFPDGSQPNKETINLLQNMYMELYNETLRKTPFTFPVTTACFAVDDERNIIDRYFLRNVMQQNLEFGFMNLYAGKTSTLSSCCRLRSEGDNEYFNSFGSGGTKIGSLSVVTLNLPRIAMETREKTLGSDKSETRYFFQAIETRVVLAAKINHVKRHIVKKRIDNGNLPLYDLGFMDVSKQYSTCGINGINEALEILGYDILTEDGQRLVREILETVNSVNAKMQQRFKTPHNCEQTPSENSSIKLAQVDKLLGYQKSYQLYSNQFIPLTTKADLLDRIKLQGMFDELMTGGAICHLNVDTRITNVEQIEELVKHAVKQGVVYSAINYNIQRCVSGHMSVGKSDKCSICGELVEENFTRVVGFLTSTKNWHKVRREIDYPNRQFYKEIK